MSRRLIRSVLSAIAMLLLVLVVFGPLSAKIADVESNSNAAFLPSSAESTRASSEMAPFIPLDNAPTVVVYVREDGPVTNRDMARALQDLTLIRNHQDWLDGVPSPPIKSADGHAIQLSLPLDGEGGERFTMVVDELREIVQRPGPPGLVAHVTGVGGVQADLIKVLNSIDGPLVAATALVVVIILLVVYRSPFVWVMPLVCAGTAYVVSTGVLYLLAKQGWVTLNGQNLPVLTVLVFGATTDYALLLIARYREELHRHQRAEDAMKVAWRSAMPAIVASSATVALGLMCLLASELESNKGLGPIGAVGVASSALASLVLLPQMLMTGRKVFWPRVPALDGEDPVHEGFWARLAERVAASSTKYALGVTALLVALAALAPGLNAGGLPFNKAISSDSDSVLGQAQLEKHFPGGLGSPVPVIGPAALTSKTQEALQSQAGVKLVVPFSTTGVLSSQPEVKDGRTVFLAVLDHDGYSPEAKKTVEAMRTDLDAVSKDVLVGGFTGFDIDIRDASRRDVKLIIPLVLVLILLVLCVLLRSLVAPLLLMVTVVLSYGSALGVCSVLFHHVFDFPGADASFPLFAMVFLVALGVDYNIFLMTRVREEAEKVGTREGMKRGLTVTGGVITSAGVVLAATFAALIFLPLIPAAQMGIAVSFGVLLDTFVVRSLLVPALVEKVGDNVWWPSKLATAGVPAEPSP